jgi:hypothetical protein
MKQLQLRDGVKVAEKFGCNILALSDIFPWPLNLRKEYKFQKFEKNLIDKNQVAN